MKLACFALSLLGLTLLTLTVGCAGADQPASSDQLNSFVTAFDSTADKVTTAADQACQDLKLADISSSGTKVVGKVTAQTDQGDDVSIDITQTGDNVSQVTIRVGATGDQAISRQLADRIKAHLSWFHA